MEEVVSAALDQYKLGTGTSSVQMTEANICISKRIP